MTSPYVSACNYFSVWNSSFSKRSLNNLSNDIFITPYKIFSANAHFWVKIPLDYLFFLFIRNFWVINVLLLAYAVISAFFFFFFLLSFFWMLVLLHLRRMVAEVNFPPGLSGFFLKLQSMFKFSRFGYWSRWIKLWVGKLFVFSLS